MGKTQHENTHEKMAPSKQRRYSHCDPEVKRLLPTHQRCQLVKEAQKFTGKQINHYLNLRA